MIKVENYPNAYKEVYTIIQNMNKDELELIPKSFIEMLKAKMNRDYEFELDENVDFEEQTLLQETKVILGYLFLNYWATKEQNDRIMKKFKADIIKEEQVKQSYNPNELFEKNKANNISTNETKEEKTQLIEYKKKNIFARIFDKFKNLFKK